MPAIRRRWTPDDVRALSDGSRAWPRYELIDGELLVTSAPSPVHQLAVVEVIVLLNAYLAHERVGVVVSSPADLELRPGTITQPDVFVIPSATPTTRHALGWPDVKRLLLAVEVLSPGTAATDRVAKRDLYLESGVAEYWLVDVDARVVERWTPAQESPIILRDRLTWAPAGAKPLTIDLPELFDRIGGKASMMLRSPNSIG